MKLMEDYLSLKNIFPAEVLWEIRPKRLVGRVMRRSDRSLIIKPDIELSYPDGTKMLRINSSELREFGPGDYVLFSMKDAKEREKVDKGQPHLQEAYDLEYATPDEMENYEDYFGYPKLYKFGRQLEEQIGEAKISHARIQKEINDRTAAYVRQRSEELDQKQDTLIQKEIDLVILQKELEQTVQRRVTEEIRAFESREVEIAARESNLSKKILEINQKEKDINQAQIFIAAEKLKLEQAVAQFRKERDDFYKLTEIFSKEDQAPISVAPDISHHSGLNSKINRLINDQGVAIKESVTTQFLLSTLTAAITGQFVILSGPTGVGKTSMVNIFASAVGAGNGVVPVRPAWIDPTDLLGFYNPQQNRYQASTFMDRFLEAERYSKANRLYFLTLDEMNLSRVENYAADFLSRLEKARAGESEAHISLYSKDIERQLRMDIAQLRERGEKDLKSTAFTLSHLSKYPSSIKIPDGLIMFGTINLDETTHHLSPKFLDRSFVINIPAQNLTKQIVEFGNINGRSNDHEHISLNTVRKLAEKQGHLSTEIQNIWDDIMQWQTKYIHPLGIWLGFRFSSMYGTFMRIASNLDISPRAAASVFLKSKLLPWISFHKDERANSGESNQYKIDVLEAWTKDVSLSYYPKEYGFQDSLTRILDRNSNSVIVQYLE